MDENKQIDMTNVNANNASTESGGGINFDQLLITQAKPEEKMAAADVNNSQPTVSVDASVSQQQETSASISAVNALLQEEVEKPQIDISNIEIEELSREDIKEKGKIFEKIGEQSKDLLLKIHNFNYRKIVSISIFIAVFCAIASGVMFGLSKYMDITSQPKVDPNYQSYVDNIKDYKLMFSEYTNINDYYPLSATSFINKDGASNVDMVLNSKRLRYISKKDIFQNGINGVINDIKTNTNNLENLKKDITKYGFFPQDLMTILGEDEQNISIKKSLMSLEVVKFSTAIKVFSYLETFIKGLANILGIDSASVQTQIQDLEKRGEKDILIYLNSCYLNPFEIGADCNLVGDFDRYYKYNEKDAKLNLNFFKKLMEYIDLKLEQSDLPSFSIVFQRFDPKQKQISFNVEVNTFQQDEASLIKQGIVNPHIFVVTQLINLLKQSLFVIGENIDAKQISIQPKIITIGSTTLSVNSSSMTFNLPIQKNPQREIADFILNSDYFKVNTGTEAIMPDYDGLVPSTGQEITIETGQIISGTGEVNTGEVGVSETTTGAVGNTGDVPVENQPSVIGVIQ